MVEVVVDAEADWLLSCEEAALVEAVEVWFPPFSVTVTVAVEVRVTVGVVDGGSVGEGGLAGEKSALAVEAMPKNIETSPRVRPALSRFLRVMLSSSEAAGGRAPSLSDSSSFTAVTALMPCQAISGSGSGSPGDSDC